MSTLDQAVQTQLNNIPRKKPENRLQNFPLSSKAAD